MKALALSHIAVLDQRITELEAMKRVLMELAAHCHGDDRPGCPILEGLASEAPFASATAAGTGSTRRKAVRTVSRF